MFWPSCGNSGSPWPAAIPRVSGRPIRIEFRPSVLDGFGVAAHAATFPRQRRMVVEEALMADPDEFARIFVHELFHFVWLRIGNAKRRGYEQMVGREWLRGARGELGWSAEWRKEKLTRRDYAQRSRRWREYCCESFCDTAAWRYGGVRGHAEFTLAKQARKGREKWFTLAGLDEGIRI